MNTLEKVETEIEACPLCGGPRAYLQHRRECPQCLLRVGTTMNERLIGAIMVGYAKQDATEDELIMAIYGGLCAQPLEQTAAQAMAGMFALAKARKWDLVLVRPDGGRVVIPCDTEEEQSTRALEYLKKEKE